MNARRAGRSIRGYLERRATSIYHKQLNEEETLEVCTSYLHSPTARREVLTSPSPLQHRCGPHSRSVSKLHSARLASLQKTLINVLTTAGGQNSAFCTCPRRGIRWCKRTGSRSNRRSVTLVRLLPRVGGDREKSRCASCTMRCKEFSDQSVMSDDLAWKVLF
jgi:hypothetical protein